MKTKFLPIVLIVFLFIQGCCQTKSTDSELNLDFEIIENGTPKGWYFYPQDTYLISSDSKIVKSGKYSVSIEFKGDSVGYQPIYIRLPQNYEGEKITLSGYIKTENVTDGYAGLWMRIDPKIALDNMSHNGITGTTDWEEYKITLDMNPEKTTQIFIGVMLVGKGKVWFDNIQVTFDGVDIKNAKVYEPKPLPAELDEEFLSSNIVIPISKKLTSKEDKTLITNLELMGKLWGFLKYHHPEVGKGNYNWDNELFQFLPEYLKAKDNKERDKILLQWIEKLGEAPECKSCKETSANAVLKPDLLWIENFNMNAILKEKIKEIYRNRHQGEQFYLQMERHVGNPVFVNEKSYSHILRPDAGLRLLALYRYWNMIQYFFPYKHLTDKNWNDVLKEYIPKFVLAEKELEYQLAVLLLTGEINDSHANLKGVGDKVESLRGNWQAPFQVRFVENKLVVMDYYKPSLKDSTGLDIGDVITHINGKKIESIIDSMKIYYPASNEASKMNSLVNDLVRSTKNTMNIDYISAEQIKQKMELTLYNRNSLNMNRKDNSLSYKMLYDNILVTKDYIGYVTLKTIQNGHIDKIKKEFMDTKGIIIDIRNYPSTFVPFLLGSFFVSDNTPFVKFSNGNLDNPGEFTFQPALEIPKSEKSYQGKLVVIVNEETISQAEYTAMAFRAGDHTVIIGSQTAGADGNVSEIVLPGGLKTMISGIGVYYPDGRETQRIGIIPDIEVKPTIQGIREGRDEVLEKAIEFIKQGSR